MKETEMKEVYYNPANKKFFNDKDLTGVELFSEDWIPKNTMIYVFSDDSIKIYFLLTVDFVHCDKAELQGFFNQATLGAQLIPILGRKNLYVDLSLVVLCTKKYAVKYGLPILDKKDHIPQLRTWFKSHCPREMMSLKQEMEELKNLVNLRNKALAREKN